MMEYKQCDDCSRVVEATAPCCPDCGYDEFTIVSISLIENSSRIRNLLESIHLGGSMSGWDNGMLEEIQDLIEKSSK